LKNVEVYWISVAGVLAQTQRQRNMSAISVTPHITCTTAGMQII